MNGPRPPVPALWFKLPGLLLVLSLSLDAASTPAARQELFNGKDLTGWKWVARDNDPAGAGTWTVQDGVIRASGEPFGYLRTETAYRDYRLVVEWRYLDTPMPLTTEGKPRNRNSGLLLHMQEPDQVWPLCLEAQLAERNSGDFISMGGATFAELEALRRAEAAAAADDKARERALALRRLGKKGAMVERPAGQWNTYTIECRGSTVTLQVNGVYQNTATALSLSSGAIALQSEGAPIEFRRVSLEPLP